MSDILNQKDAENFARNWVQENYPKGYSVTNIQKFSHDGDTFEIVAQVGTKSSVVSLLSMVNPELSGNSLRLVFNSKGETMAFDKEYGKKEPAQAASSASKK